MASLPLAGVGAEAESSSLLQPDLVVDGLPQPSPWSHLAVFDRLSVGETASNAKPCNLALLLSGWLALGQMNTGEISGSVQDLSGSALPGATVVAQHAETGQKFTAVSNSSGEYLFAQLPVGVYSMTVSASQFQAVFVLPRSKSTPATGCGATSPCRWAIRTEVVTIEAEAGSVQLESAEIRDVIGRQQVVDLPLKGRQFLDLAMLSPGVVRPPGGTRGDAMQQAGNLVNVLGQRSGHNLYLMDGVTITDEHFNNMVIAPSIDAIEEFNIEKTSYAPEFGGKSGAVINVVSRSGSNNLHGSLFEFVRNDVFDAKNFFDSAGGSDSSVPPKSVRREPRWSGPQEQDVLLPEL